MSRYQDLTMGNQPNLPPGTEQRFTQGEAPLALWAEFRGIAEADLARRTAIPLSDLQKYLSGDWRPTEQEACLLACALGIEVFDVLHRWDARNGEAGTEPAVADLFAA